MSSYKECALTNRSHAAGMKVHRRICADTKLRENSVFLKRFSILSTPHPIFLQFLPPSCHLIQKNVLPLQKIITKMKSTSEILFLLRQYKPTAMNRFGLTRLGIFGSVARGEQTDASDVDVCYEGKVPSLLTLDMLQTDLEKLLGCRVDMVRIRDGMNQLLRSRIQKEGIYV